VTQFFSEALSQHDRTKFVSGNDRIDLYFRNTVSQDVKRRYAACYVLVESQSSRIAGFYTLSSSGIPLTEVPPDLAKKLPRYPTVPAILIGWLGRDTHFRGRDIGPRLLYDAIARIATSPVGAHAIFADAIDEAAEKFYRRHQFVHFNSRPRTLFLPVATALQLLSGR
jgi:ribosomal protein S18 acetylase RimI-like enzyme